MVGYYYTRHSVTVIDGSIVDRFWTPCRLHYSQFWLQQRDMPPWCPALHVVMRNNRILIRS